MNEFTSNPNPGETAATPDSAEKSATPEIRNDAPIRVPADLIPPAEAIPQGYELQYQQVEQHESPRATQQDIPQDFRVPWKWTDIVLFVIFYLGISVVIEIIFIAVYVSITHRSTESLKGDLPFQANAGILSQAIASVLSIPYLWALIRRRQSGPFWQAIGWRPLLQNSIGRARPWLFVLGGIGLAILVTGTSVLFPSKQTLPMEEMFHTRDALIVLSIYSVLIAPFIEETIFRGLLYPVVGRRYGTAAAIVITGIIFGSIHALQLWGGWTQIGTIMIVGIVLTWARARQYTVLASFLIHISYNSTITLISAISTGGFRHI